MSSDFPITVSDIKCNLGNPFECTSFGNFIRGESYIGRLVNIRPCAEEYEDKTYIGLYLGDCALSAHVTHDPDTDVLTIERSFGNPAIYVFELKKVIFGCESWWGVIEKKEDLDKVITDESIQELWYVKALKAMLESDNEDVEE